ncbi:hypothetical protein HN014_15600 [Aquimarina sp. TRL1]|uniref:hypothetical protein n=1 Tax=Aquimarina sp. (strain TRL1) TaxID=2736252 RepID=UPI00158AC405|nr:hypothetical protein [Aquimarina sp. TRL1]QKX06274.1 hypothetical protein HN014_15600 [Aquimarina sp. TRL1]
MNKIFKFKAVLVLIIAAGLSFSCSKDDNDDLVITDPTSEFDAELIVTEDNVGNKREVSVNADSNTGSTIKAKVKFSSTTKSMRRLYITQDIGGVGEEPFVFTSQEVDEKPDGSLDLVGDDKKDFEFQINLDAPANLTNGTVVYKFWATTGRGDFRDITKRNALGDDVIGTITIKYGNGNNSNSGIHVYEGIQLFAPLADGSSSTFLSLYNNSVYKINQGEEYAALWDFGYYYGASGKASLSSTDDYPSNIINIATVANTPADEVFNKAYFSLSAKTTAEFDAISNATDLDFVTQSTNQTINSLSAGDVVEFVDNYGKKGLIKVTEVSGTFGTGDFIKIDIKVQL